MPEEPDPFNDPNAPDMPPMPTMAERRAEYYESRHGKDSFYAKRNRAREGGSAVRPGDHGEFETSATTYNQGGGESEVQTAGKFAGDAELVAAVRELIAAVRGLQGI